jgi:uncharacterized radical SAM superfamily Fe-S cluster-containing enzyme
MPEHLVDATQWQQDFNDIDFWVGRNIIGSTHLCVREFSSNCESCLSQIGLREVASISRLLPIHDVANCCRLLLWPCFAQAAR